MAAPFRKVKYFFVRFLTFLIEVKVKGCIMLVDEN